MKQILLLLIGLLLFQTSAEAQLLSEKAQISLLTSSPYEGEVFTVYGHAALRLKDEPRKMDLVFNYGIFSFEKPNFIYRFAKGETDYMKENTLSYTTRIGKTTFIVNVKQSESAKKPLNTVFQEICRHEMLGDFSADKYLNLENLQKSS